MNSVLYFSIIKTSFAILNSAKQKKLIVHSHIHVYAIYIHFYICSH